MLWIYSGSGLSSGSLLAVFIVVTNSSLNNCVSSTHSLCWDSRAIHPFTMRVKEVGTESELFTVERPLACGVGACKCCCYQSAKISSGGADLAVIKEGYYYCIPTFNVTDAQTGEPIYKIHPPTCLGGLCVNCCTEGNPCGKGCCKYPFWVFDANQTNTGGGEAEHLGKILKLPKSMAVELVRAKLKMWTCVCV